MATKQRSSQLTDYKDITLPVSGEELRVYRIPENWVTSVVPARPRPRRPMVAMQTKTGTQERRAKSGDVEFDIWEVDTEEWENERDELQEAVRLVLALRDYPIPDPLEFPDHIQDLIDADMVQLSENEYVQDAMWLKAVPLAAMVDEMEVYYAIQLLSGFDQEAIDEMRRSFRDNLLGQASRAMGEGTTPTDSGEPEENV